MCESLPYVKPARPCSQAGYLVTNTVYSTQAPYLVTNTVYSQQKILLVPTQYDIRPFKYGRIYISYYFVIFFQFCDNVSQETLIVCRVLLLPDILQ